jgi:hypothetical protein
VKNIDGIQKVNSRQEQNRNFEIHTKGNSLLKHRIAQKKLAPVFITTQHPKKTQANIGTSLKNFYSQKKVSVAVAVFGLLLAFGAGMWTVLDTKNTVADTKPQILGAFTDQSNSSPPVAGGVTVSGPQLQGQEGSVSNDALFNTPIEYLKNYLDSISAPAMLKQRTDQIEQFLKNHHSPLSSSAGTIAQQDHWRLILAISFAESTLGKNCVDNNCSNIGVKPGAPSWHQYSSYDEWVVDFNHLLDKRYKDSTLEQMCGVYVQPCNPNWLAATKQILTELQDQGIN